MPDPQFGAATSPDVSRQVATSPDQYVLSIEQAQQSYDHAGYPRTLRSIQRYCKNGELDCLRQETPFGVQYKITPESVARHIAQIAELASATGRDGSRLGATSPDLSRQDATSNDSHPPIEDAGHNGDDEPRQAATGRDLSPDLARDHAIVVEQLERRLEEKDERIKEKDQMIGLLTGQMAVKDEQISTMAERAKETNVLIQGLQKIMQQLQLGAPRNDNSAEQHQQ